MLKALTTLSRIRQDNSFVQLMQNSGWTLFGSVIFLALGLIRSVYTARAVGLEAFGILALITATIGVINYLIDFRVWETVVKYVAADLAVNNPKRASAAFKYSLGVDAFAGLLAFLVVVVFARVLNTYIIKTETGPYLLSLYALSLVFTTVDPSASAFLRVANRFDLLSFTRIAAGIALTLAIVVLLHIDSTIENALIAFILGNIVSSALTVYFSMREANRLLIPGWWKVNVLAELKGRLKEMTSYTIYSNLGGTLKVLGTRLDIVLVGILAGPSAAGIYRLASTLAFTMLQIADPMYNAIFPELSRFWTTHNYRTFSSLIRKTTILAALISVPVALVAITTSSWIIGLLYGSEYHSAAIPFSIIIIGLVFATPLFWTRPAMLSMDLIGLQTRLVTIVVIIQLLIVSLLAPSLGATAAALGQAFALISGHVPPAMIVLKRIRNCQKSMEIRQEA